MYELQDEVTSQIAVALNLELVGAEAARPTDKPDALDYMLRGKAALYHPQGTSRANLAQAVHLFQRAMELDPASIDAQALLAVALGARVLEQLTDSAAKDLQRAEQLAQKSVAVSPRHPLAHFANAQVLRAQGRYAEAIPEYELAIAANRNWVVAIAALGICRFFAGSLDDAITAQEQAIRLSPRDPILPNWYWRIGMIHLLRSRLDAASLWLERARSMNPQVPGPHGWLASAYALAGDAERAASELAEARQLSGDGRYSSIAEFARSRPWAPQVYALAETTFFAGLRLAGVPET